MLTACYEPGALFAAIGKKAMNLALWLERAGSSHGDQPALGLGSRVIKRYGEVAGRAARLAASLRHHFFLQPANVSPSSRRIVPITWS